MPSAAVWIVTAVAFRFASGQEPAACADLAERQQTLLRSTASAAELAADWRLQAQALSGCGRTDLELEALRQWAEQARRAVDPTAAIAAEQARRALAAQRRERREEADALRQLGNLLAQQGDRAQGLALLAEAARQFEELGERAQAAAAHSDLSRWHRRDSNYLAALADEQRALALRRQLPDPADLWRSLLNIAVLYEQLEQFAESRRYYEEALAAAESEPSQLGLGTVLASFAGFLNDFGAAEAEQALAYAQRAYQIESELGRTVPRIGALMQIGRAHYNAGRWQAAERALEEAWSEASQLEHPALRAHLLFRRGELARAQGRLALARERLEAARDLYLAQDNRHRLIKVYAALEALYGQSDEPLLAAQAGRERFRLKQEIFGNPAIAYLGELLARFELAEERLRNAELERARIETELRLAQQQRDNRLILLAATAIVVLLMLVIWRHWSVRRLLELLRRHTELVERQAKDLAKANQRLTEQSQRLYEASITDALTGLGNRAHAMERLHAAIEGPSAKPSEVSLLLLDLDHFKGINDRYGHQAGDQVLRQTAQAIAALLPSGCSAFRMGGEEFMVLCEGLGEAAVEALAEAIRERVASLRIDHGSRTLSVSVSIGLCHLARLDAPDLRTAYAQADRALYRAKHQGRNQVVCGDVDPATGPVVRPGFAL
jgi:diguanylate cyclase (GGDEF)-like protein